MIRSNVFLTVPHHIKVAAAAWISKIITAFLQIFYIRFFMSYLGTEMYAGFAILVSLSGWFALIECGLGPALQNFISESRASKVSYNSLISNTNYIVFILFLISISLLVLIAPHVQYFLFERFPQIRSTESLLLFLTGTLYIMTYLFGISYRGMIKKSK